MPTRFDLWLFGRPRPRPFGWLPAFPTNGDALCSRLRSGASVGRFCLKEAEGPRNESALRLLGLDPREDEEANRFAAALLLPAIAVKAMLEVRKVRDPVALREAFGVTSHVLWCRLKELGYFL